MAEGERGVVVRVSKRRREIERDKDGEKNEGERGRKKVREREGGRKV